MTTEHFINSRSERKNKKIVCTWSLYIYTWCVCMCVSGAACDPCAVPITGATKSRCQNAPLLKTRPALGDCL